MSKKVGHTSSGAMHSSTLRSCKKGSLSFAEQQERSTNTMEGKTQAPSGVKVDVEDVIENVVT